MIKFIGQICNVTNTIDGGFRIKVDLSANDYEAASQLLLSTNKNLVFEVKEVKE